MEMRPIKQYKEYIRGQLNSTKQLEERLSGLKDNTTTVPKFSAAEEERFMKNEAVLYETAVRKTNVRVIGINEDKCKEKGTENIFKEIIAEEFSTFRQHSKYKHSGSVMNNQLPES